MHRGHQHHGCQWKNLPGSGVTFLTIAHDLMIGFLLSFNKVVIFDYNGAEVVKWYRDHPEAMVSIIFHD
jgi:hypothetical protein